MFCVLLLTTVCLYAQTLTCVTLYARVSLHIVRRYLHNIAYHVTWLNEHINMTRKGVPPKYSSWLKYSYISKVHSIWPSWYILPQLKHLIPPRKREEFNDRKVWVVSRKRVPLGSVFYLSFSLCLKFYIWSCLVSFQRYKWAQTKCAARKGKNK